MTATGGDALDVFFANLDACTDKTAFTHGMHPYPAKFIPHIPRALIAAYAPPSGLVLDPMCGSGTALVEAAMSHRQAIGCDLNPIATLAARAKTTRLDKATHEELAKFDARLGDIETLARENPAQLGDAYDGRAPEFRNRDKWFQPHVVHELTAALEAADMVERSDARNIARCAISAMIVAVSNQESETRWCAKPKVILEGETVRRIRRRLASVLISLEQFTLAEPGAVEVSRVDSRHLPVGSATVDFIVTSPPYANSHDYYLYNKLRMFWLGFDVRSVQMDEIGSRNRHSDMSADIDHYLDAMGSVLSESRRVLKDGGMAAFVVGDAVVRGKLHDMGDHFSALGIESGFTRVERHFRFSHRQFNSTFQRGFGTRHAKQTHVLVLR